MSIRRHGFSFVLSTAALSMTASGCARSLDPPGTASTEPPAEANVSADRIGSALRAHARRARVLGEEARPLPTTEAAQADAELCRALLVAGIGDIALSEHAARHAPSAEIRGLAGLLARSRIESNARLSEHSGERWPRLRDEDRPALEALARLRGVDYELAYLRSMVERHADALALLDRARTRTLAEDTRRLAADLQRSLRIEAAMVDELLRERAGHR